MNYVLDACSLIAFIDIEDGHKIVKKLFDRAEAGEVMLYMSIVNLIEVFYHFIRVDGIEVASKIIVAVSKTPLTVVDRISQPVYQEAARLKAVYKRISIADVIGLATAKNLSATFVTGDHHEMDKLEQKENYQFLWVR
ncbi:MAG: hypothetical protein Ta2A_23590 [Treponemataceae bacterium]|nr:MAG: hypothetical protein Ta2A_23590 [Treponemataceae bacterium]